MFPGFYIADRMIGTYAVMAVLGGMVAVLFAFLNYRKRCRADADMILMFLWAALGAFAGSHLLYAITNIPYFGILFTASDFIDFLNRLGSIFGGAVFYGGLLGGMLAGYLYMRHAKMDFGLACDCAAPAIPLFHMFGRIGCFLGGCCYGVESEHGITFTESLIEQANGVPRVPVQLYEAAFNLALFIMLWIFLVNGKFKGRLLFIYLPVYAVGRFILEFWRGDEYRGFLFGLSTSQIISILVFAVSAAVFIFSPKKQPEANIDKENTQ